MNTKLTRLWLMTTAILGVAIMVLTCIEGAMVGTWFDEHGLPNDLTSVPEMLLLLVGLVITFGSIFTVLSLRKTVDSTVER
jgi:hypothetical protein